MIVGIDLGTTNSAVAAWRAGEPVLIPNSLGHFLTPSAVSIDEGGRVLVGLSARERQSTHPDHTVASFKRYMGSARLTVIGGKSFLPEELSSFVLKKLKEDAEVYLGEEVTEAIITVPAYFNDKQRKATRLAGELAGFKVERLLNEPTAAALAYGIHNLANESRFLVFDLGGGTFDVSILEIFEGVIEVRASTGDNRLGGDDFNQILVTAFVAQFKDELADQLSVNEALEKRLTEAAERTRRALTGHAKAEMAVTWRDKSYAYQFDEDGFEALCETLLSRLREPVLRALRDSDVPHEALNEIILVGGATRMPVVRRAVTRMFGRFPNTKMHPDHAVALGAAVQAGLKSRDAALKEVVLTDVSPYTLGVNSLQRGPDNVYREIFVPIIERNTVVPTSRMRSFFTIKDLQTKVTFKVYQGESRTVTDNVLLGDIDIAVPPGPAGKVRVDVRFTYDINGLMEVDIEVPATGARRQLLIVNDDDATPDEIESRRLALTGLKQHPRDADANKAALGRAQRCYENFLGHKREQVGQLMMQFEVALDGQDPRRIEQVRRELGLALDALEGQTIL